VLHWAPGPGFATVILSLAAFLSLTQRAHGDDLLIFSAAWCGHCQTLKNDLEKNPDAVDGYTWGFVDADQEKDLMRQYGVKSLPTLVVLDDKNNEVKRQVGYRGMQELRKFLRTETHSSKYGVNHGQTHVHYVGGPIRGARYRSRWDD
jgi:thioredoxin 1